MDQNKIIQSIAIRVLEMERQPIPPQMLEYRASGIYTNFVAPFLQPQKCPNCYQNLKSRELAERREAELNRQIADLQQSAQSRRVEELEEACGYLRGKVGRLQVEAGQRIDKVKELIDENNKLKQLVAQWEAWAKHQAATICCYDCL